MRLYGLCNFAFTMDAQFGVLVKQC